MINRKQTKGVYVRDVKIGDYAPISIQSMTNTDTRDVKSTVEQIKRLEEAGCEIVRLAVVDTEASTAIAEIKKQVNIPLVADIHFDYRLAIESMKNGADKIRINPGNIGGADRVKAVVDCAKAHNVPIRIGINSGSIQRELLEKYGAPNAEAMVESASHHIRLLEDENFTDIIVSLKASDVLTTIEANRIFSERYNYPLHLGITESGTIRSGTIKSSVGLGAILASGIGDTMRVSLTGDPVEEITVARNILSALDLRFEEVKLVSCPTCGRCQVDLIKVANEIEEKIQGISKNVKVAIMGCAVNGPGEAREADIGVAGGKDEFLLFKKGKVIGKLPKDRVVDVLLDEINKL